MQGILLKHYTAVYATEKMGEFDCIIQNICGLSVEYPKMSNKVRIVQNKLMCSYSIVHLVAPQAQ